MIHGDSVYDIIDKQDHASIQSELMRGLQPGLNDASSLLDNSVAGEKRIFLCRMNVSRNARRQMRFGDQKVCILCYIHSFILILSPSQLKEGTERYKNGKIVQQIDTVTAGL